MRKIGFVVNPIAGMGGKVGLKGTDGMLDEAIKRKAKIVAVKKAEEFLSHLKNFDVYTASHLMGENECKKFDITAKVVYKSKIPSNSEDTKNACKEFLKYGVDIIIFVGGDGTARDVYSIVKKNVAILGIPAGVKMYSGVFAFTPYEGAEIINNFEGFEEKVIESARSVLKPKYVKRIVIEVHPSYSSVSSISRILEENGYTVAVFGCLEAPDQVFVYAY